MSSDGIVNRFVQALEGIPHMVANALTKRSEDIKTRAEAEIEKIVSEFNIEDAVRKAAEPLLHNALTAAIENHFSSKSGQQAINDHIEKILSGKKTNSELALSEIEKQVRTTPASDLTEVVTPLKSPFADPISLDNLKGLIPGIIPIPNFSPLTLTQTVEALADPNVVQNYALIVDTADAVILLGDTFHSFFDPITKVDDLTNGQLGSIYGLDVYSDAHIDNKFLTQSGLLKKPVELVHTTATDQTMAEVAPS